MDDAVRDFLHALYDEVLDASTYIEIRIINEGVQQIFVQSVDEVLKHAERVGDTANVYIGVAVRSKQDGTKDSVPSVQALWADYDADKLDDDKEAARASARLLMPPPSFVVDSGYGYHAYWLLDRPVPPQEAEKVLRAIRDVSQGDNVCDAPRVMRLPGTWNVKQDEPVKCEIVEARPELRYSLQSLRGCTEVSNDVRLLVLTGQFAPDEFKSRSERDWHVVTALLRAQVSHSTVRIIFEHHPVGQKHLEVPDSKYLERTIGQAATRAATAAIFMEQDDCTFALDRKGKYYRVATFTYEPERLLAHTSGDTLVGVMRSRGYTWESYLLPKGALTRVSALLNTLKELTLIWEGSDREVRLYASYLMDKLFERGFAKAEATQAIGRHEDYWVNAQGTFHSEGMFDAPDAPVVYVPTERVAPSTQLTFIESDPYKELLEQIAVLLPQINRPEVIWPILGWMLAAPFKPVLEKLAVRFPFLNLYGTRGSGKTATILNVMQPLMGYDVPRALDCNTTQFVLMAYLSSTNAVPISLAEFRRSTLSATDWAKLRRFLLTSYDIGSDARGRPDQTTEEYLLTAPISLDGEDKPTDPALMERTVVANLVPEDIREGTEAWQAYNDLVELNLRDFAGPYILWTLTLKLEDVAARWAATLDAMRVAFPQELPDRVRRNLGICWFGIARFQEWCAACDVLLAPVEPGILAESLDQVVTHLGRTYLFVDDFVEDIVNAIVVKKAMEFSWNYRQDTNVIWIHLAPALNWWLAQRRRQGQDVLEPVALKQQLKERDASKRPGLGQYVVGYKNMNVAGTIMHMHGIDLTVALAAGLDIPATLDPDVFTMRLGRKRPEEEPIEPTPAAANEN